MSIQLPDVTIHPSSKSRICNSSHNTLLRTCSNNASINYFEQPSTSHVSVNYSASDERNILAITMVVVRSYSGQLIPARALLDSGSQPNLITEELAQLLRLKVEGGTLNLNGIGETNSLSKSRVNLTVNSTQFTSMVWVLKSIKNLQPDLRVNIASLSIPSNPKKWICHWRRSFFRLNVCWLNQIGPES